MAAPFASFSYARAIVKSNTANFDGSVSTYGQDVKPCDAIWVGGAGTMVVVLQNGVTASLVCAAGTLIPVRAIRVNSTSTDASLMVALYQDLNTAW